MSTNTDIEEIITLKSVDVYQLSYNRNHCEYDLISIIKDSDFRIFREVIDQKVDEFQRELSQRLALIKCKDWFYPLEKDKTFIYRYRDQKICYIFPDTSNPDLVSIVVVNTEVVDEIKVILLENVLLLYSSLQDSSKEWKCIVDQLTTTLIPTAPPLASNEVPIDTTETTENLENESQESQGFAHSLAKNIVYGAELINSGISYGTQFANNLVKKSAAHIRAQHNTNDTQNTTIDPRVTNGLKGLRTASQTARSVTGYAVSTVAKGTHQLGKCLAPHVRKHSTKLISSVSGKGESDSGKICDDICTVASGGLEGFATLYNGITENAKLLANTITNETVDVVNQRYGQQAATATENAMYSAGNAALTVQNIQHLGPKAIAKKAVLDTGKNAIVDKQKDNESQRKT